jgi:hypothetical protein
MNAIRAWIKHCAETGHTPKAVALAQGKAIDAWLKHCAEEGRVTQAQAMEQGIWTSEKAAEFATYCITSRAIYCNQRGCGWSAPVTASTEADHLKGLA